MRLIQIRKPDLDEESMRDEGICGIEAIHVDIESAKRDFEYR